MIQNVLKITKHNNENIMDYVHYICYSYYCDEDSGRLCVKTILFNCLKQPDLINNIEEVITNYYRLPNKKHYNISIIQVTENNINECNNLLKNDEKVYLEDIENEYIPFIHITMFRKINIMPILKISHNLMNDIYICINNIDIVNDILFVTSEKTKKKQMKKRNNVILAELNKEKKKFRKKKYLRNDLINNINDKYFIILVKN